MFQRFLKNHKLSHYAFRSDWVPPIADRAFWDAFPKGTYVAEAQAALDYGWPVIKATDFMAFRQSGDRMVMEKIHFDRRNHLVLFALAELTENQGRFLPQLVNGIFAICEETYWGLSAHLYPNGKDIPSPIDPYIDLFAAETAEHMAMILSMLRAPLLAFCPEIVKRIEYELEQRIKLPFERHDDFWWMGNRKTSVNNWNPWILSNVLSVYLLTEKEPQRLQKGIERVMLQAQHYYDSLPADGGCDEGPSYWGRAGASLFEIVYQLKQASDGALDLFDDEKLRHIASYLKKVHLYADLFTNVADAHATGLASLLILLYGFARETKQKDLMNFSVAAYRERTATFDPLSHEYRTMRRLLYHAEFLREMDAFAVTYPLHGALECLPGMELAVLRQGNWILAAKGGFNAESHNHNDVGSFLLYDGATPILADIGISTYTRFTFDHRTRYTVIPWTRGSYHNLPIINGVEQREGAQYRSDRFSATERALEISFPCAYPAEAGVDSLLRTLILSEAGLCLTDRFGFAGEGKKVTEVFMAVRPVRIEDNIAIVDERFRISANAGKLLCETVPFDDAHLTSDWKTDACQRILLECDGEKEICIKVEKI